MRDEYLISANLAIVKESRSGLAFLADNDQWYPRSQVEISDDQKRIIAMSPWIYEQKHGRIPHNVVRVLSKAAASKLLNPSTTVAANVDHFDAQMLAIGVYEKSDGSLYVVKPTRDTAKLDPSMQRKYASRIVEQPSNRLREDGATVTVEFKYEQGAINSLRPSMLITLARAEELSIRYGRCILCGRFLKVEESVKRGVGPVCAKYFPSLD